MSASGTNEELGILVEDVPGDGWCFFYAVNGALGNPYRRGMTKALDGKNADYMAWAEELVSLIKKRGDYKGTKYNKVWASMDDVVATALVIRKCINIHLRYSLQSNPTKRIIRRERFQVGLDHPSICDMNSSINLLLDLGVLEHRLPDDINELNEMLNAERETLGVHFSFFKKQGDEEDTDTDMEEGEDAMDVDGGNKLSVSENEVEDVNEVEDEDEDEELLPITIRIIQSVDEYMTENPFFSVYNDQDLVTMIHNLLKRAKVPENIIHGKALGYFHLIKEYHKKRQAKFALRDNILLRVRGARPDFSDTESAVKSLNVKKPFIAQQKTLNDLYMPLPARIADQRTWIPQQNLDVQIEDNDITDRTDYVRLLQRDQQPIHVIGYSKRPVDPSRNPVVTSSLAERMTGERNTGVGKYKTLEHIGDPFNEEFEKYMNAVDRNFDVNGFIKKLTSLTDLETLAKMLYEYDSVEIDDLTTNQQKVIFFHLMRLADLEKPQRLESSSEIAYKPKRRAVKFAAVESVNAALNSAKEYSKSIGEITTTAETFEQILSDAVRNYEQPDEKLVRGPQTLFDALMKQNVPLEEAVRQMRLLLFKKDLAHDVAFLKELIESVKQSAMEQTTTHGGAAGAAMERMWLSLKDEITPIVRKYELHVKGKKGSRTFFLDEILTSDAVVADEQVGGAGGGAGGGDVTGGIDDDEFDADEGDERGGDVGDVGGGVDGANELEGIDIASIKSSMREHLVLLLQFFRDVQVATQLPLDYAKLIGMYDETFKATSRFDVMKARFGEYIPDDVIYRIITRSMSVDQLILPEIEEDVKKVLKKTQATFEKELTDGLYLGLAFWVLDLQVRFAKGQLADFEDPVSYGCNPYWGLFGPPMSEFKSNRGLVVFIMCAIRFLWQPENSIWRVYFNDVVGRSDKETAEKIEARATKEFTALTSFVKKEWKERLEAEEAVKKRINPYLAQLTKMSTYDLNHIRAYKTALLYLPSILVTLSANPAKLLLPLRNTCCVQELNGKFKAYGDIRALDKKEFILKRQTRFFSHYRHGVDARKGLAKMFDIAGARVEERAEGAKKRARLAVEAAGVVAEEFSTLDAYEPLLTKLMIRRSGLTATRERFFGLLKQNSKDKEQKTLEFIDEKLDIIDESIVLAVLRALSQTLQTEAGAIQKAEVSAAVRQGITELMDIQKEIKAIVRRRGTGEAQRIDLRDVLAVVLYRVMLLPCVPTFADANGLSFIVAGVNVFTLHSIQLRGVLNAMVGTVGRVFKEVMIPSQKELFDYITRMRESQKREKISKYESMNAFMKDDARLAKTVKLEHYVLAKNPTEDGADDIEIDDPYETMLGDNDIQDFYEAPNQEEEQMGDDMDRL